MVRTLIAMAVAAFCCVAISGASQAAPIAPLSADVAKADGNNVTPVYWYGRRWYGGGYYYGGPRYYGGYYGPRCYWRYGYRYCY
jgi:hypothetical protein